MTSVLSKPWKDLLEVTCWGEARGKPERGATRDVISREPVGCPCGSSLALQSIPVALGCFSWLQAVVPGWESSKCWTPETFNGVGLILAFGTAGFSDHEAAQALSLTWLLPLFSCSRSLCWSLIITLFSVELSNLFLAASEESYSSYWFLVLRILTRVSVFGFFYCCFLWCEYPPSIFVLWC